jgi:inorganic pyrophosphatase
VEVEFVVEIPQGSRNKYEMDHATGRIRLDRMLFTSTRYPLDYGFIPDTLAEDGDPLDVLVMLDEPTFPGCLVLARPVGVFWMHDEHGPDAKILTVPARDPRYAGRQDFADVPEHLTTEIGHFFDVYKELEPGKGTDVRGWQDRAAAEQVIEAAFTRAGNPADSRRGAFFIHPPGTLGEQVHRLPTPRDVPQQQPGTAVRAPVDVTQAAECPAIWAAWRGHRPALLSAETAC